MKLIGTPNPKQAEFFRSTARFTAYGGARGGGKSWALRRKLIALCLRYPGIHCLIIRRTLSELRSNHVIPLMNEIGREVPYSAGERVFTFKNRSRIELGYLSCDADTLRYQGQEYDIIAIDEATQLTEYQFSTLKGCLRGVGKYPRRMYLTCNPGGVGHSWVKRLFIDRRFREGETASDYKFIQALVYDNKVLTERDPEYVEGLKSLPDRLRAAWLEGRWDLFEGQFFPEFSRELHVCAAHEVEGMRFCAFDYGFDRFALLVCSVRDGNLTVLREHCESNLTISEAGERLMRICGLERERGHEIRYAVASPDLWNRRQESGLSGFEIMSKVCDVPLIKADNRRIPGWRALREALHREGGLKIFEGCRELIESMESLLTDTAEPEDASDEPHSVTHAPEALRYAVMSRIDESEVRVSRTANEFGFLIDR